MLKVVNLKGETVGSCEVAEWLESATVNSQLVKDYVVALRANARQWSANTKGRSEVNHSTKKPHPQKGQGRSRQGSLAAPQYKGGGRVFGPKPKFDQHIRLNQKERQAVIRALLGEKIRSGHLVVLNDQRMETPKTKVVNDFFNVIGAGRRTLIVGSAPQLHITEEGGEIVSMVQEDATYKNLEASIRNIPDATFRLVQNISGYDILLANDVVVVDRALEELQKWLAKREHLVQTT